MQRGVRLFEYDAALASIASCKDRLEENLTQFQRDMNTRRTFSLDPATTTSTFHHGDAPLAYLYEWGLDSNDEFVTFYDSDDAFFERDYGEDEDDDFQDGLDPAGEDFGILVPKIYHAGESHRRKQARRNRDAGEELSDWEVNYLEEDDSAKQTLRDIVKRVESNVLVTAPEKLRYDKYRRKVERNNDRKTDPERKGRKTDEAEAAGSSPSHNMTELEPEHWDKDEAREEAFLEAKMAVKNKTATEAQRKLVPGHQLRRKKLRKAEFEAYCRKYGGPDKPFAAGDVDNCWNEILTRKIFRDVDGAEYTIEEIGAKWAYLYLGTTKQPIWAEMLRWLCYQKNPKISLPGGTSIKKKEAAVKFGFRNEITLATTTLRPNVTALEKHGQLFFEKKTGVKPLWRIADQGAKSKEDEECLYKLFPTLVANGTLTWAQCGPDGD